MRLRKGVLLALFILYLVCVFILLFYRTPSESAQVNLRPFATIGSCLRLLLRRDNIARSFRHYAVLNLTGNLFLFFPLGYLAAISKKRPRLSLRPLLPAALFILCAEVFQGLTRLGAFDVDDLILNLTGCWIGYALSCRNRKKRRNIE